MSLNLKQPSSSLRKTVRISVITVVHVFLFAASGYSAFLLRFDFNIPWWQWEHLIYALTIWTITKTIVFQSFPVNRVTWRFVSLPDAIMLLAANLTGSLASAIAIRLIAPAGFPRSIYIIDLALCLLFTSGIRLAVRMLAEASSAHGRSDGRRALIYGAGDAGVMLLREVRANPKIGYKICGFVDDDPAKTGRLIHGVKVFGTGDSLTKIAPKHQIQHVLIAMPSATGPQMVKILNRCAAAQLSFQTVPALSEGVNNCSIAPIRDVAVADLLGRTQVSLDDANVRAKFENQVVLVTGAAGSIGSELCRQIARFRPKLLVGFDVSETGLFYLDREMQSSFPNVAFKPEIGSILSTRRLREVFESRGFATVFHAAAYKHVPLMETHVFEAFENNVVGTYNVATMAERFGVKDFVLISSDKAVRPTSIMGLTKHVAELMVSSLQNGSTKFVSVRFGNVLGSNGSVVAIFKEQIAAGGPVTVTHPEMRRYFMTIPEAAQLVLQASTMGRGGEVFVLDMGQPMKIVDLARNMILLSGRRIEDIRIDFTGTRPGEKLYEELSTLEEETLATYHEKIRIFSGDRTRIPNPEAWMDAAHRQSQRRDMRLILVLKTLVTDYNPSSEVLQRLMDQPQLAPQLKPQAGRELIA
ncbi:MAG: nucleoside-diphosphate sugar epimerase/dehydratase [Candidatus Acidiferrales bacterium]